MQLGWVSQADELRAMSVSLLETFVWRYKQATPDKQCHCSMSMSFIM